MKRYVLVGEAKLRPGPAGMVPELNAGWVPSTAPADRDPRNAHNGGRFCMFLDVGAVEAREGDRIVLLRPAPAHPAESESGPSDLLTEGLRDPEVARAMVVEMSHDAARMADEARALALEEAARIVERSDLFWYEGDLRFLPRAPASPSETRSDATPRRWRRRWPESLYPEPVNGRCAKCAGELEERHYPEGCGHYYRCRACGWIHVAPGSAPGEGDKP